MTELVLREDDGGIALLTMNRPEAMNALSMGLRAALAVVMTGCAASVPFAQRFQWAFALPRERETAAVRAAKSRT